MQIYPVESCFVSNPFLKNENYSVLRNRPEAAVFHGPSYGDGAASPSNRNTFFCPSAPFRPSPILLLDAHGNLAEKRRSSFVSRDAGHTALTRSTWPRREPSTTRSRPRPPSARTPRGWPDSGASGTCCGSGMRGCARGTGCPARAKGRRGFCCLFRFGKG